MTADDTTTEAAAILRGRLQPVLCRALRRTIADADAALALVHTPGSIPRDRWDRNRAVWQSVRDQAVARLRKAEGAL